MIKFMIILLVKELLIINTFLFTKMLKNFLKKALKKDKLIVKKTDNEIMRYIKQTNIIEERKRYEELMKLEDEKKKKGLNDKEKIVQHFSFIDNIDKLVYNKPYINDNVCDFSYLHDKQSYQITGKKRWFFLRP